MQPTPREQINRHDAGSIEHRLGDSHDLHLGIAKPDEDRISRSTICQHRLFKSRIGKPQPIVIGQMLPKQKIFALFDYYPVAVDIKNTILPKFPYLLTGVSLSSQPLKKALFGVGWGPIYANFYAALLLNTQSAPNTWSCGDKLPSSSAGMTLSNHSCPEFNFGLNVAVGAITDALKNKASSGTPANGGTAGKK